MATPRPAAPPLAGGGALGRRRLAGGRGGAGRGGGATRGGGREGGHGPLPGPLPRPLPGSGSQAHAPGPPALSRARPPSLPRQVRGWLGAGWGVLGPRRLQSGRSVAGPVLRGPGEVRGRVTGDTELCCTRNSSPGPSRTARRAQQVPERPSRRCRTVCPRRPPMGSVPAPPPLRYRSTRLLRAAFQLLHQQQERADVFCDVVLRAEGEAVVAHCSVLSVCSPFFMEQLGPELPPRGCRVVLELAGLKIGVLRKLVRFFYTAELEVAQEEVQEVLAAARRLRITELEALQLQGGRLVRLGPQRQLNRSCLCSPQQGSPATLLHRAAPSGANIPPGSTGVSPQGQPCSLGPTHLSPIRRVRLRKVESRGCWEVVQDTQPPPASPTVPVGHVGATEAQPPLDVGELGSGQSPPWQSSCAACRQQGGEPPAPQQGCGQAFPGGDPEKEEEVDVGTVEFLPAGTVCFWPCPSSESDEEVDVLT
ncbi:BTB/POZ domain-containing protein 18 [Pseudopipra pipra]|uniref:BTB/POZ domain-containing protein 18 n=1 Tax=Pseudopipra pipra TaxID=415032 RepID=UPI003138868B